MSNINIREYLMCELYNIFFAGLIKPALETLSGIVPLEEIVSHDRNRQNKFYSNMHHFKLSLFVLYNLIGVCGCHYFIFLYKYFTLNTALLLDIGQQAQ